MRSRLARAWSAVWRPEVTVPALLVLATACLLLVRQLGFGEEAQGARDELVPAAPIATPEQITPQGSLVRSLVLPDGRVTVTHWIRSTRTVRTVTLSAPSSPQVDDVAGATGLTVRTTSGELSLTDREVGDEERTIDLVRPSTLVRLQYTLQGATQTSDSRPTRGLVGTVALTAEPDTGADEPGSDAADDPSKQVHVFASSVLSLACSPPDAGPDDARPCGRPLGGRHWVVALDGDELADRVSAQVDLRPADEGD